MEISQTRRSDAVVFALDGRLDAYTAPELRHQINQAIERDQVALVVDLRQITFVDSSGLAVLVSGMKRARQKQGDLHLAGLQPQVSIIFRLTRLDQAFDISDTVEDAVTALQSEGGMHA